MNVTLGVPRLKEIINASKLISTPIIEARLVQDNSLTSARIVKAQIEKTRLKDIASYIKEVHCKDNSYISILIDEDLTQRLHLKLSPNELRYCILNGSVDSCEFKGGTNILKALKPVDVQLVGDARNWKLRVYPPAPKERKEFDKDKDKDKGESEDVSLTAAKKERDKSRDEDPDRKYFKIQALKAVLPYIIVKGCSTVNRAVINEEMSKESTQVITKQGARVESAASKKIYYLLVEGYGLREVMGCAGVDGSYTKSNHIIDMQEVLGIEAARCTIAAEISFIMKSYGIAVDTRHLLLLSDVMTFKGEVLGITRFGVAKMRESVLMLASFEKTTDHLFDAAVHSRQDAIVGVSECIIMGVPIPIGTGLLKLIHKLDPQETSITRRKPMLA